MKKNFNHELNSLRAVGIIFVIILHSGVLFTENKIYIYNFIRSFSDSESGVELLFILAGFLLSNSLFKSDEHSLHMAIKKTKDMFIKKFKRLFPACAIWVLIPLVMSLFFDDGVWLTSKVMLEKVISSLFFLRNFYEGEYPSAFGYMWAVSLEFQFFVIFTFIYFLFGKEKCFLFCCIIIAINFFYRLPNNENMFMFRFDALCAGYVLVYLKRQIRFYNDINQRFVFSLVSVFLIFLLFISIKKTEYLASFRFSSAVLVCFVLMSIAQLEIGALDFMDNKITRYIASRSYSLYCCHIPAWFIVISIYGYFKLDKSFMWFPQVLSMLFFTELTYRYIEGYFNDKK